MYKRAVQFITQFDCNFSDGPGGIVAHGDEFRIEVLSQNWQEFRWKTKIQDNRLKML